MNRPPPPPAAPLSLMPQKEGWDSESLGFQACNGPTTGYRNGAAGVIELKDFADGWIPSGWFGNPIDCSNCTGSHATTTYVKVG